METYLLATTSRYRHVGEPGLVGYSLSFAYQLRTPQLHGKVVMSELKIGIILGSTRPGRHGADVAEWVLGQAAGRPDARYELVDLADRPLPLYLEAVPPSYAQYQNEHTKAWAATIASYDGFIFVTPSTTIRHPQHSRTRSTTYMASGRTRLRDSLPTARRPGRVRSSTCV